MSTTSLSLLDRLRNQPDGDSWARWVTCYGPLLDVWLGRCGVQPCDADDLKQEVLTVVVREIAGFEHSGRPGAFRSWLRTILVHRVRHFWREKRLRPTATGDSDCLEKLDQLESPASGLSQLWDREHDQYVVAGLLRAIEPDFEPQTLLAFRRVMLDGRRTAEAAAELAMSEAAVLQAKCRVLRRLREVAAGFID